MMEKGASAHRLL